MRITSHDISLGFVTEIPEEMKSDLAAPLLCGRLSRQPATSPLVMRAQPYSSWLNDILGYGENQPQT
jgi:hypothetical protein